MGKGRIMIRTLKILYVYFIDDIYIYIYIWIIYIGYMETIVYSSKSLLRTAGFKNMKLNGFG